MGMLRDDPGGYFQKGYGDGAAGRPFGPPSIPAPSRRPNELIPKFSENPMGWFLGVLIVIELWTLWQLVKAPFQLVGALMRSEKPSPWVIIKNVVVAGLAIALVWWVPRAHEIRGPGAMSQAQTAAFSGSVYSVSVTDDGNGRHTNTLLAGSGATVLTDQEMTRYAVIAYNRPHDIVHAMCPTGFRLDGARSTTGNRVALDTGSMADIEILPGKPNNLMITCRK
jgi:hypothetical protein